MYNLSVGQISRMFHEGNNDSGCVVQVIDVKKITTQTPTTQPNVDRYRLVISDGNYFQQAMLATQLNELIQTNSISKGSVIRLLDYLCNTVHNRRIVIILNLESLGHPVDIIGNPQNIETSASQPPNTVPQPQQTTSIPQQNSNLGGSYNNIPPRHQQSQPQMSNPNMNMNSGINTNKKMATNASNNQKPPPTSGFVPPSRNVPSSNQPPRNNYGSNLQQPQQPPQQPNFGNKSGNTSNSFNQSQTSNRVDPIRTLNPYHTRWRIKAKVINKSEIKYFQNSKTQSGNLFSVDLCDAQGGEIRATFFNCDENFYHSLQKDGVYYFSKGVLKTANKKFTSIKNEYEINFDPTAVIENCEDGTDIQLPPITYVPIQNIQKCQKDDIIDVLGLVISCGEITNINTKKGTTTEKRTITLIDTSGYTIDLTLWGSQAITLPWKPESKEPILSIRGVKVSDFNSYSLTAVSSTNIVESPDISPVNLLRGWWDASRSQIVPESLTKGSGSIVGGGNLGNYEQKFFSEIKDQNLGNGPKPDTFKVRGTISSIRKENLVYYCCGDPNCGKKAIPMQGYFQCTKCNRTDQTPTYKYLLAFCAYDHTGSHWLNCFDSLASTILGRNASDFSNDSAHTQEQILGNAQFKQFTFTIRAKQDEYKGVNKVKCSVISATPLDFSYQSSQLLQEIDKLSRM